MRASYKPSGGLVPHWFFYSSMLTCAVAAFLGLIAFGLLYVGFYLLVLVPLVAGLVIGFFNRLAVFNAHCRNRPVTVIAGVTAGLIFFTAYFYAGLISEIGLAGVLRVDLLPTYVQARMESDLIGDVGRDDGDAEPIAWSNWGFLFFEVVLVTSIVAAIGWKAALHPYSDDQDTWMDFKVLFCRGVHVDQLMQAMESGSAVKLLQTLKSVSVAQPGDLCLTLYYCDHVKYVARPVQMYLVVNSLLHKKDDPQHHSDPQYHANGKSTKPLELNDEEIAVVSELFAVSVLEDGSAVSNDDDAESPFIENLKSSDPGLTIDQKVKRQVSLRSLRLWLFLLPPLIISTAWLCFVGYAEAFRGTVLPFAISLIPMLGLAVIGLVYEGYYRLPFQRRMLYDALAQAIQRRGDALFDPYDPRVRFVNRMHGRNGIFDGEFDQLGVLLVDAESGAILMEGESQRWRIPLAQVAPSGVVPWKDVLNGEIFTTLVHVDGERQNRFVAAVWVLPLAARDGSRRAQEKRAEDFAGLINAAAANQQDALIASDLVQ